MQQKIAVRKKRNLGKIMWQKRWLYVMLLPMVILYIVYKYIPMYGVVLAFKDHNLFAGIMGSPWVGFDNFIQIFSSKGFYSVLRNTIVLSVLSLVIGFPGPIIVALFLNEIRKMWYKRTIQSIIYLPHFISWVIVASLFIPMLSPSTGIVNTVLGLFGIEPIYFMGENGWWIVSYVLLGVWKGIGWGSIIYLASLSSINPQLYEASTIDGAGRWKQTLHITLPGIKPTIVVLLIMNIGKMMAIGFDQPYLLGNPAVLEVSDVISTYVYRIGIISGQTSIATAVGLFQSVVSLILLLAANYLSAKLTDESLF